MATIEPVETVADGWESYRARVLPADAGDVQISETRRAFYAGAWMMLTSMMRANAPDISYEDAAEWLARHYRELEAFGEGGR